ncbi:carbon storage regulator CsrA [Clostridium beijerinckii]|uniref:carbon storage regulator CsrA n=1 Tax=Clostridium beijerinckii TaxID=1520 RepID=UPI0013616911|nr:carbon storage regulator CsrA [Clostridium beijerinckii]MZK49895.1 carbon storage regulator CsrA [Clostridium beijerinckii]MZK57854.1 carbon storage regulator CsrA [Clostridium beijerinckii]MZK68065.1 carbon storage regulator CsrA [Clostridium beijerinckii]MZK73563.1 carbon storage regulator CsrA [Clostridium beijerinckii]MZK83145.1 carbon storage regulator CsrA [Clostridium beijerinckii]
MLIITRKKGESLMIGDDIEIVISKIDDGSVKIGIKAPKDVQILRKELYEEVEKENKEAAKIDLNMLGNIKKR